MDSTMILVVVGIAGPVVAAVIIELLNRFVFRRKPEYIYLLPLPDDVQHGAAGPAAGVQVIPLESPQAVEPDTLVRLREMETSVTYAGFWPRFYASSIDLMIVFMAGVALYLVSMGIVGLIGPVREEVLETVFGSAVYLGLFLYFSLSWGLRGQTIGYRVLGLRLLRRNFRTVSIPRAFLRCLCVVVAAYTVIGVLMIGFTPKKRGLADYLAGTVVLKQ